MKDTVVKIYNQSGLHARLAASLVKVTNQFTSRIEIEKDGQCVDGKSIMGVLTLAASYETELRIIVEGPDEEAAVKAIEDCFNKKFREKNQD